MLNFLFKFLILGLGFSQKKRRAVGHKLCGFVWSLGLGSSISSFSTVYFVKQIVIEIVFLCYISCGIFFSSAIWRLSISLDLS